MADFYNLGCYEELPLENRDYNDGEYQSTNPLIHDFNDLSRASTNRLNWIDSIIDDDLHQKLNDTLLTDDSSLRSKFDLYLNGTAGFNINDQYRESWDIPETHPLKVSMTTPGAEDYHLNHNWYDRLQWSFKNLLVTDGGDKEPYNEAEYVLLSELGKFVHASKYGATNLLHSLLESNMLTPPEGYLLATEEDHPKIHNIYKPKFENDSLFVNDGIVYTLVLGNSDSYDSCSYTKAKKLYSNDGKGKQSLGDALYTLGGSRFALPVQCMVDYLGLRVVAEPLIPVFDAENIFKGLNCHEVSSLLLKSDLYKDLKSLSKSLNLVSWPLPFKCSDITNDEGGVLIKSDRLIHFRNTHEALPPLVDTNSMMDLFKRLRPEYRKRYKGPFKCTIKSDGLFGEEKETNFNNSVRIILSENLNKLHNVSDSWDITYTLHSLGINIKYIGSVYELTTHASLRDVLAADMVARSFKHLWDLELQSYVLGRFRDFQALEIKLLNMINDTFGLTLNSSDFWLKALIPQISFYFNVVRLNGISSRSVPHVLLKNALEYHMGIFIPDPTNGIVYDVPIKMEDLAKADCGLLGFGLYPECQKFIYPRVHFYPLSLNIHKTAARLYKDDEDCVLSELLRLSSSFGMGISRHVQCKLMGLGYPCDPICILNTNLSCVDYQRRQTALNLFCLLESMVLYDPLKRLKLLLALGYEYLCHFYYSDALECAQFVIGACNSKSAVLIQAKILEIECHSLTGSNCNDLCTDLLSYLDGIEGIDGLFKLQLLLVMAFDSWKLRNFQESVNYIHRAKESFLQLFNVPYYEWVPIAYLSLLGYCYKELDMLSDSTKTYHEVVRYCNLSNLPTFTMCNLMWVFIESLIRIGSYDQSCKIAMELLPIIEKEFGSLSIESLRALYVAAWINHQIGCIHLLHPYLYLSNSDKIIAFQGDCEWYERSGIILDELSAAGNSVDRRRHCEDSLRLYNDLFKRLRQLYEEVGRNITQLNDLPADDEILNDYFQQQANYKSKMLLVIKNILSLKTLSLSTAQYHVLASKLYNTYVSQVSSDYVWSLSTGVDEQRSERSSLKQRINYSNEIMQEPETFMSSLSIKTNSVPRFHDLRSIEVLLMKTLASEDVDLCNRCLDYCNDSNTPDKWFDDVFGLEGAVKESKFTVCVDILRNFLTPCQRLVILGHVATITRSNLEHTSTYENFKKTMLKSTRV